MSIIPRYEVDSGDFTPQEILDVIPEQERLDKQVQQDEEKYLRALEQNAADRIRNVEKTWSGLSKLSSKVGDILKAKQDKHRKDRKAELKHRVLLYGVGENLQAHFSGEKRDLFDESVGIHKTASTIEQQGDLVSAEEFRDLSKWEQYAIQEEYARKIGTNYGLFVENAKKTVSIEVTDPDGTTRTVKFPEKPSDYQPNASEIAALNDKIQFQFAYQLDGIENEALIAEQVRPHVLEYNEGLRRQATTDRANARKTIAHNQSLVDMTSKVGANPEEGFQYYEDYTAMYLAKNGLTRETGMEEANVQFGMDLVTQVQNGQISYSKALATIRHIGEGAKGKFMITDASGLSLLEDQLAAASVQWEEAKKLQRTADATSDSQLLTEMGPISNEQAATLTEAFNEKYDGNIPSEIKNVLKGYQPDDEAIPFLKDAKRAQGGVLYPEQLRNVSNEVFDQFKGDLTSAQSHLVPGSSAYKTNAKYFDGYTQKALESNYGGSADIKAPNFLNLRANVEATYNDAYKIAYAATKDEGIAHKQGMAAMEAFLANPDLVAEGQTADYTVTSTEKKFVEDISIGIQQGKNNQWKTNRMSMAGKEADDELLAWVKDPNRSVKTMPEYYVKVARGLGIPPEKFGIAQAALITQEPYDESDLAEEMTEDKAILQLIFKNPNTFSVIQGVMMLEQDGEEITKDNSLFNNPSVINDDI